MQMLPGVAEADLEAFGDGVARIQEILGDHFAPAQGGGRFTSAPVGRVAARLKARGARGIGQSSWGPTGFAFASDPDEAQFLARRAAPNANRAWRSESAARAITAPRSVKKNTSQCDNRSGGTMAKNILHMMTPLAHMSPFDVNMAIDAGYDATASYTNVSLGEITDLVQDAMFSRSPRDAVRTGVFIGGKDALLALDMLDAAGKALLKPFEISLFADPAGSFTTAAAMIAVVEKTLKDKKDRALRGAAVSVFGATGVVGTASGVIAALEGASVTFVGRDGTDRIARHAAEVNRRFGVNIAVADGSTPEARAAILAATEVVLCAAKAGVRVLDAGEIAGAAKLLVAADVNAVPPPGIEGVDAHANGAPLGGRGALGVGALAIGNVKYRTESGLFKQMTESKTLCGSTSVRRSSWRARSREA